MRRWPNFGRDLKPRHIFHEFGPRVRIAAAEDDDIAYRDVLNLDVDRTQDLEAADIDPVGALGLAAFKLRSSAGYLEALTYRHLAGAPWDTEEATRPDPFGDAGEPMPAGLAGSPSPPEPMKGRIGVGVVIVDGPTEDLAFSEDEKTFVVAQVQNGLAWYGSQMPGGDLTWVYDIPSVAIDVAPDSDATDFEELEARWRDPALAVMSFGPGIAGADDYVASLKTNLGVARAYCAFFAKYPIGHFAYATIGGPRLVMNYELDNWGPRNMDRVFAHETGHIFGAPDEYAASNCNCGGSWGSSGSPNSNCANCASGGAVDCIMLQNDWALCAATPGHLGW